MQIKLNNLYKLWLVVVVVVLTSCSAETTQDTTMVNNSDGIPGKSIRYVVNDVPGDNTTRALFEQLSQFSETVLTARGSRVTSDNLIYKDPGTGSWVTTSDWMMPASGKVSAYGISPTVDILADHLFDKNNRYFDYVVPVDNQTVIKIGSKLNFTADDIASDGLVINFSNATASLVIRATNKLQLKLRDSEEKIPVQIYVKKVTIHNLKQKGRFNFSTTKNTDGNWVLNDELFANYSQDLNNEVLVTNGQTTPDDIVNDFIVVLPQSPEQWPWAAKGKEDAGPEDAISVANADHKCYIELECRITATVNNQTYHVWGSHDGLEATYASIYLPYVGRNASPKYAGVGAQGVYLVRITETTALDEYGRPIKPQESSMADQFRDAEFINVSTSDEDGKDNVDDWEPEQTPVTVTL